MVRHTFCLLNAVLLGSSLVLSAVGSPHSPFGFVSSSLHRHLRRVNADPEDQSWIKSWAAVGDSYAAGIGAGQRLGGIGDYFCSRTDESYPNLMNTDERFGPGTDRKFTFWACSGAKTPEVTSEQIAKLDDRSQQMITVSSGGNDVGLVDILNHCIFQWNPSLLSSCDGFLKQAQTTIDSDDFAKSLENLLSTAKAKLTDGGTVYWTGYAQFFGIDDKQCDSVTWSFWWSFLRREYLTLARRRSMNELVINMNKKISEAVERAGDQAVFVNYDQYYADTLGRYCESGYAEPFGNRAGLLLYEYYTNDDAAPDAADGKSATTPVGHLVMNGTFEGDINAMVQEYKIAHPEEAKDHPEITSSDVPTAAPTNLSPDQANVGTQVAVIPDSYARVFHPRPGGHALISSLIFYNMAVRRAKQLNQVPPKQDVTQDTCPAASVDKPKASDRNECHGVSGDTWVMHKDTAVKNVGDFCAQGSNSVEYNDGSVDHLRLSVNYPADPTKTTKDAPDCSGRFIRAVIDGCDGDDHVNNPFNYKFGSTLTTGDGWVYKMEPLSRQINEDNCDVSYRFLYDGFEVRGKNWADGRLGVNGEGLLKELKGCGAVTNWKFERTPNDVKYQWYAHGHLPIGTKNCVGRAVLSAGGSSKGNCHGAGRKM